jgi:RNA ligase
MASEGFVRRQEHPSEPLMIYNYTAAAQYGRVWNDVTRQCRGLIVHSETGQLIARPFPKFYNYGEHEEGSLDVTAKAIVTDKLDGSLGILYPLSDGTHAVATRGSFTSEQAIHATEVWRSRYAMNWTPMSGITYLFEILYPSNRIVVDYGDRDDLVLLECLDTERGYPSLDYGWPGPKVETFPYATLADALAAPPRPNSEGFVVYLPSLAWDIRVKLKQEDYVALHRIVTGLNERTVWQHLMDDKPLSELIEPLPDEFHPWVREVAERLTGSVEVLADEARAVHDAIVALLPPDWTRKDYALQATKQRSELVPLLFLLLDGKDIQRRILYNLKPEAVSPAGRIYTEDVA